VPRWNDGCGCALFSGDQQCVTLTRQFDVGEVVAPGHNLNPVRMVVALVRMIMPARFVEGHRVEARGFLYGGLRADGAYVVGAAVQALHAAESGESSGDFARRRPFDADFFAALGANRGGREQGFGFVHGRYLAVPR
jgi:hypothetical protein